VIVSCAPYGGSVVVCPRVRRWFDPSEPVEPDSVTRSWGLTTPKIPDKIVAAPDFGLVGHFSLFGGFAKAGVLTAVLLVFTLILSDFFDAMGTIVGISAEAGLLDEKGQVPGIGRVLFIDGAAAVVGGIGSASSNTAYIESAAAVGEGARTGFANLVTGGMFGLALFLTPLLTIVPLQAAAPALIARCSWCTSRLIRWSRCWV
jgi:AGZA family xanthine/uracil permease-like MFS transporter